MWGQALEDKAHDVLREHWGYSEFRAPQLQAIRAVVGEGRDAVVVVATGGGKSLVYQVPPLVTGNGVAIVITPLLSLMHDQVEALHNRGVAACKLGSDQAHNDMLGVRQGQYRVVYMTPERAEMTLDAEFWRCVTQNGQRFVMLAVDEAHCVSEWGHDFRPAYKTFSGVLRREIRAACVNVPVVALTATATEKVRTDLARVLEMDSTKESVISTFDRPNLAFSAQKGAGLGDFLSRVDARTRGSDGATICYTQSKAKCDNLCAMARRHPNLSKAEPMVYHAGMNPADKTLTHDQFIKGKCKLVFATVAFGMGIDKHDVRAVFHLGAPSSLEAYYQEAGRAGRDGRDSICELWWSERDWTRESFLQGGLTRRDESGRARTLDAGGRARMLDIGVGLGAIKAYAQSTRCRRTLLVEHFAGKGNGPPPCGMCDNCRSGAVGRQETDFTKDARLLMSAVQDTGNRWSLAGPIDCLAGSRAKAAIDRGYENLASFGRGKHHHKDWWRALGAALVAKGLLTEETVSIADGQRTYNKTVLTREGRAVLGDPNAAVRIVASDELLRAEKALPGGDDEARAKALTAARGEPKLFEALKDWRRRVVEQSRDPQTGKTLPPYCIFTDAAIASICAARPNNLHELLAVNGVGQVKADKYGDAVLQIVKEVPKGAGATSAPSITTSPAEQVLVREILGLRQRLANERGIAPEAIFSEAAAEAIAKVRPSSKGVDPCGNVTGTPGAGGSTQPGFTPGVMVDKASPAERQRLFGSVEGINKWTAMEFGGAIMGLLGTQCQRLNLTRDVQPVRRPATGTASQHEADRQAVAQERNAEINRRKSELASTSEGFAGFASNADALLAEAHRAGRPTIVPDGPSKLSGIGEKRFEAWLSGQSASYIANNNRLAGGDLKPVSIPTVLRQIIDGCLYKKTGDVRRLVAEYPCSAPQLRAAFDGIVATDFNSRKECIEWMQKEGLLKSVFGADSLDDKDKVRDAYAVLDLAIALMTIRSFGGLPQPKRAPDGSTGIPGPAKAPRPSFGATQTPRQSLGGTGAPALPNASVTPSPAARPPASCPQGFVSPPTAPSSLQAKAATPAQLLAVIQRSGDAGLTEQQMQAQFGPAGYSDALVELQNNMEIMYDDRGGPLRVYKCF